MAAVVIGGVSLVGGRGGIFGPVVAAFVLTLIPADLIFMNIDPNFGQVIQGTLIVLVVMLGGFFTLARNRANERSAKRGLRSLLGSERLLPWLQRNTIVVLILLLVAFVGGIELSPNPAPSIPSGCRTRCCSPRRSAFSPRARPW